MTLDPIPFIDLAAQRDRIRPQIDDAIKRVVDSGQYILGSEITQLEQDLSAFSGATHTLSCASGTDALALPMMALGLKPGDAVFVPAFTFVATAEVVAWFGAIPVFVDVDPRTFNMDMTSLAEAVDQTLKDGLTPRGIIPVDLFGQPADYPKVHEIADHYGLWVIADAAQGFGGRLHNQSAGALAPITATSFFPAKPLGCYGDGGAVFCEDPDLLAAMESCRMHGQGTHRYEHVRIGMNGRMDAMQAAIVREKLKIFPDELEARNAIAARYTQHLKDCVATPYVAPGAFSAWAQYTLIVNDRAAVQAACQDRNVPTAVYYPVPLNQQPAYAAYPVAPKGVTVSESLSHSVISLPMHPYLSESHQDRVIEAVRVAHLQPPP